MKKPRNAQCVGLDGKPKCSNAEKYPECWYCMRFQHEIHEPTKLRRCNVYDGPTIQVYLKSC